MPGLFHQIISAAFAPKPHKVGFLDLPPELRDMVYRNLLCVFESVPLYDVTIGRKREGYYAQSAQTAILRVNKKIYREAYDVMIKTNRFIHVKFLDNMVEHRYRFDIPTHRIICRRRSTVEAFKGYSMAVTARTAPETPVDPWFEGSSWSCMILGEDCFCLVKMLNIYRVYADTPSLDIRIDVAPYINDSFLPQFLPPSLGKALRLCQAFKYLTGLSVFDSTIASLTPIERGSLEPYFSREKIQRELLEPFLEDLHGITHVQINGVEPSLARAVQAAVAEDEWEDPEELIQLLCSLNNEGRSFYHDREFRSASTIWEFAVVEIIAIRKSSSWAKLVAKGGFPFQKAVNQFLFDMCLETAHVQLSGAYTPLVGYPTAHSTQHYLDQADDEIRLAIYTINEYHQHFDAAHKARLLLFMALLEKADALLLQRTSFLRRALDYIVWAKDVAPDDEDIAAEEVEIRAAYEMSYRCTESCWLLLATSGPASLRFQRVSRLGCVNE